VSRLTGEGGSFRLLPANAVDTGYGDGMGMAPPRHPPRNLLLATAAQLNLLLDESTGALEWAARERKV